MTTPEIANNVFIRLEDRLEGDISTDSATRHIYATDASSYREIPQAVVYPKTERDIQEILQFANEQKTSIIPRAAGTSLAGQVVGKGIVMDVSRYMTRILEVNQDEKWVRVQPGVIRDELNMHLEPYGLMFGPETSTANRAMIGGMIGNNSCGANSVVYGSTRDHLLELQTILSDGSQVRLGNLDAEQFSEKRKMDTLEGNIHNDIDELLRPDIVQETIRKEFPKPQIPRRNTGYALDLLLPMIPFTPGGADFNFCKLLAGSEGTLAIITEAKLKLEPLPLPEMGLMCVHFDSIYQSLQATLEALKFNPSAVELMDNIILDCTKDNIQQRENRFFIQGDPKAILIIEIRRSSLKEAAEDAQELTTVLKAKGYGYHYPFITGADTSKVWNLRKGGLGSLGNIPGDGNPVPVVEDTAVEVSDLPEYIKEFNEKLAVYNLECVHYAHAGSGELHIRPILNLKTAEGNKLFRKVAEDISKLVKKYNGSLSGEHGDGRVRGEFIPYMIGETNYELIRKVKKSWDPNNVLNPGKIVDTPPMNEHLRFFPGQETPEFETAFDFSDTHGLVRAAEKCNGSGDCRKTHLTGGTMCPSYMASKMEKDTTRARANIFREILTYGTGNPFQSSEIDELFDRCLSCKGCKSECPSNVDLAKIKSEFLFQKYKTKGIPLRSRMIANFERLNKLGSVLPGVTNMVLDGPLSGVFKSFVGIARKRSLPRLQTVSLRKWLARNPPRVADKKGEVYLFIDEFTNYNDTEIGKKGIQLLTALGYEVKTGDHRESGRSAISKGLLDKARAVAEFNVRFFADLISEEVPLVGIEPSAILTFRDEYPDLLKGKLQQQARALAPFCLTVEEFIARERDGGRISSNSFNDATKKILLHGHCHQKALSSLVPSKKMLTLPRNYSVTLIPSGCCGMAGSFGYEKEHFELSQQIGELVLFPAVREANEDTVIAAAGTSCRHQILDGTGKRSFHPIEILFDSLKKVPFE